MGDLLRCELWCMNIKIGRSRHLVMTLERRQFSRLGLSHCPGRTVTSDQLEYGCHHGNDQGYSDRTYRKIKVLFLQQISRRHAEYKKRRCLPGGHVNVAYAVKG